MYYRRVEIVDGETTEPVNFVGVHPLRWPPESCGVRHPDVAFVESDEVEKLLRKIQAELTGYRSCDLAALVLEIDALLGDEAADVGN